MATSADQRLLELLEKWLGSLDRHLEYASLDDAAYRKVQDWVAHQRPTRWIIDLARQRTLALKAMLAERIAAGDANFGDALELSIFLANLVGAQHIERFIPLAEPAPKPAGAATPPTATPSRAADSAESSTTATREMPKYLATRPRSDARAGSKPRTPPAAVSAKSQPTPAPAQPPAPASASASATATASASKPATAKPSARVSTKAAAPKPAAGAPAAAAPGTPEGRVLADAVRLIQWGRKWYELPELIARMADRPPLAEVRRILTDNKALLERQTRSS